MRTLRPCARIPRSERSSAASKSLTPRTGPASPLRGFGVELVLGLLERTAGGRVCHRVVRIDLHQPPVDVRSLGRSDRSQGPVLRPAIAAARQIPRMSASASSTARSSSDSRRPTDAPSRCGSTTVVCSTSTRVSVPAMLIVGRKVAGRAPVDVGEINVVLRPKNSSACTITAYRAPRCSRPRAARGGGSRKTSPRTISVARRRRELGQLLSDDPHLVAVRLVGCDSQDLCSDRRPDSATGSRLSERRSNRLRVAHSAGAHHI